MDLIGRKFGRLTVIAKSERKGFVVCKCDCGNTHVIRPGNLLNNTNPTRSCGCLRHETSSAIGKRVSRTNFAEHYAETQKYGTSVSRIAKQKLNKNNKTGHTGVYFDSSHGIYQAYIMLHRKKYHLGSFKHLQDAIDAREEAEERMFAPIIAARNAEITAQ